MSIHAVYNWLTINHQSQCMLCLNPGVTTTLGLCDACHADLPWQGMHCRQCALPLPTADARCGHCLTQPPSFAQTVSPFLYRFPVDSLIPAFKYHDQLTYGRMLANLLLEAVQHHYAEHSQALPDLLLPMPLHRTRLARRGYNQALELARPLAKSLNIPLDYSNLIRTRSTRPQQGLDAPARRQNLLGAFRCRNPDSLRGLHLALIDDVMTTGTTADEASRTLLGAGAASVSIWCVARTP